MKLARYYCDGCGMTFWTAVIGDPQQDSYKCVRCREDAPYVRTDNFDDMCQCQKNKKGPVMIFILRVWFHNTFIRQKSDPKWAYMKAYCVGRQTLYIPHCIEGLKATNRFIEGLKLKPSDCSREQIALTSNQVRGYLPAPKREEGGE
jgi:hypothetical protein